jgi:hypothetical protein
LDEEKVAHDTTRSELEASVKTLKNTRKEMEAVEKELQ